jgi:hypothetical protein
MFNPAKRFKDGYKRNQPIQDIFLPTNKPLKKSFPDPTARVAV